MKSVEVKIVQKRSNGDIDNESKENRMENEVGTSYKYIEATH